MTDESRKSPDPSSGHYKNIGHYEHSTEVILNSKHSLRLVGGRKADPNATEEWAKHDVVGLLKYAPAAIRLYRMAYKDNPYVDEALVKLENRIEEAEKFFMEKSQLLRNRLTKVPENTVIQTVRSKKPFQLKPRFGGNPYANKGVLLLAAYDQMMVLMETCRANFLIKRRMANDIEYHGGRNIKRVFVCPGEFVPCDVTRNDIVSKTAAGLKIIEERGQPSFDVLFKKVAPEFGPTFDSVEESGEIDKVLAALDQLG